MPPPAGSFSTGTRLPSTRLPRRSARARLPRARSFFAPSHVEALLAAPSPAPRDWMLVDLDCFFVSVERARDPSLEGRPVVVGGDPHDPHGGRRGVVACASYEARHFGVRAGMPLGEAVRLLPRDTAWIRGDHAAYERASRRVMDLLGTFTPVVEPLSLDEAFLDTTGCARAHGGREGLRLAETIRETVLRETGLSLSIGVAASRTVAKVACSLAKPAGLLEVPRGAEAAFLAGLPLDHLPGIGPRTLIQLERFHLATIGDLAALPPELLATSFGKMGEALARRARGMDAAGDTPRSTQARSISRETTFAEDSDDRQFVEGMLSHLAQRAVRALREEGLLARSVAVRLRYTDFETVQASRHLARPTDRDDDILPWVRNLARRRWDRRVRLRLVGVALGDLVPATERQLDLFENEGSSPAAHLAAIDGSTLVRSHALLDGAVDRIRERHGFGALVRGTAIDLLARLPHDERGFRLHTPACSA